MNDMDNSIKDNKPNPLLKEDKPALLIVEGKEDELFFGALIKHLELSNIQVVAVGGKIKMPNNVQAIKREQKFLDNVVSLGVVRDADVDTKATFDSVFSLLRKANLAVPKKPLHVTSAVASEGNPRISVMVVPIGKSSGMLEDVCLEAIEDDSISCVNAYFECLSVELEPHIIPKAKLQVYLAAKKPELRLGLAAEKGLWNWEHPVFDAMKDFLRQLSDIPQP